MTDPILCYMLFMFNAWNKTMAEKVFANARCGWEHIWQRWINCANTYGTEGAIFMFYADVLDAELQAVIANASYEHYNKKNG